MADSMIPTVVAETRTLWDDLEKSVTEENWLHGISLLTAIRYHVEGLGHALAHAATGRPCDEDHQVEGGREVVGIAVPPEIGEKLMSLLGQMPQQAAEERNGNATSAGQYL